MLRVGADSAVIDLLIEMASPQRCTMAHSLDLSLSLSLSLLHPLKVLTPTADMFVTINIVL